MCEGWGGGGGGGGGRGAALLGGGGGGGGGGECRCLVCVTDVERVHLGCVCWWVCVCLQSRALPACALCADVRVWTRGWPERRCAAVVRWQRVLLMISYMCVLLLVGEVLGGKVMKRIDTEGLVLARTELHLQ